MGHQPTKPNGRGNRAWNAGIAITGVPDPGIREFCYLINDSLDAKDLPATGVAEELNIREPPDDSQPLAGVLGTVILPSRMDAYHLDVLIDDEVPHSLGKVRKPGELQIELILDLG